MTLIVTSTADDTISIPAWLMKALNLTDGTAVKATVEGQTLSLSPIAQFLSLRGILQDDDTFEDAINSLDAQWQAWTTDLSA
ncbi:MAG: hypothetical protein R3A44_15215 [Caldilineaceae bacterium]